MATLVLSTVGTALGGPIGGMLGSLVGQGIDQHLFGGGPRKGPRLGDLSVQTSSFGTAIPRIYGTMRVAGTVVWSTELRENSELQGDGKSQPETVAYTYSVSFAVALSSRVASGVRRIWADGKLIRGVAGDLKVPGRLRFYPGSEAQAVDPLIASEEGVGSAPAYRGMALAVFVDLQLGEFGNRIPSLTFEVDSDANVSVGDLLRDASGGTIDCDDERTLGGYAAYGDSIGAAVAPLVEAFAVELRDDGEAFRAPSADVLIEVSADELGASVDGTETPKVEHELSPSTSVPASLTLTYYDPERDFQCGQVRASASGGGRGVRTLALPCVLGAGHAKSTAESLLLRAWAMRERVTVRLPPAYLAIRPGSRLRIAGANGEWIAEEVEVERLVAAVTLRPDWTFAGSRTAEAGRSSSQPDVIASPTRMALVDLPDPATDKPVLMLAAASQSGGWKSVPIEIGIGGSFTASRTAIGEALIGSALNVLGPGQPFVFDMISQLDVELVNPDHWLQSRDDAALAMGANLAMVGNELIQFGSAIPIGAGKFRISKLLRGRRSGEWAMGGHAGGEAFVLLEQRSLKAIAVPIEMTGSTVSVTAHGVGDASTSAVSRIANGEAMRPLSPAHVNAERDADGSLHVRWVRRSRLAWNWADEIEAPVDGAVHGYRLKVVGSEGSLARDVIEPEVTIASADITTLGSGPLSVEVRQIGAVALSRPATITISE